jgi:hypothetical protein
VPLTENKDGSLNQESEGVVFKRSTMAMLHEIVDESTNLFGVDLILSTLAFGRHPGCPSYRDVICHRIDHLDGYI